MSQPIPPGTSPAKPSGSRPPQPAPSPVHATPAAEEPLTTQDILRLFQSMSTAITGVSKNIDNLGRNVHDLGQDLRNSVTSVARSAGDTLNAVNRQTNHLAAVDPNAAPRAPAVRPKDPPKLPTTTFGSSHADWIHRVPHMLRAWNPMAHLILTDWSLSFDEDDTFILPPEHFEINQIVYDMISAAVTGRARAHLSSAMQKWLRANARYTVAPPLLADRAALLRSSRLALHHRRGP